MTPGHDRGEIERVIGSSVRSAERAEWGFTNRSDVVTLVSGERLVLQRYASRAGAAHRLQVMAALAEPLRAAGVRIPRVLRSDVAATPPYALMEELPGEPPQVAAGEDLSGRIFVDIAARMGELVLVVGSIPTAGLRLPSGWATPARLVAGARRWSERIGPLLPAAERQQLARHADAVPELFGGRPAVMAHGDFGPTNVLVVDGQITGLLDWEFARLADPLFDIAWWAWLLRFHNPSTYERTWPVFAAASGIDATDPLTARRIETLQVLRVLEATVHFAYRGEDSLHGWARRLQHTLGWGGRSGASTQRGSARTLRR